jgi:hypothetical protein
MKAKKKSNEKGENKRLETQKDSGQTGTPDQERIWRARHKKPNPEGSCEEGEE